MKLKLLVAIGLTATLYSCDDQTVGIGQFVASADEINAETTSYPIKTTTHKLERVYSRSSTAYLGKFTDKDFGEFSSEFLTQINCPENFKLPETADSITATTLSLYYTSYFGDSLATMRVQIDTLNTAIEDNGKDKNLYYSDMDPTLYYDKNSSPLATKDYSAFDLTVSDSIRETDNYYPNVSISLGRNFSNYLFEKYKSNGHSNFQDAQSFINNVLKGFYVHVVNGEGSVLYINDIYMHMTVAYRIKNQAGTADSTVYTSVPLASSKEVFMSTRFKNSNLDKLVNDPTCTYLKTPAGVCTEVELPLQEMYDDLQRDTLNSVSVAFTKYKDQSDSPYKMGTPQTLLLVRKSEMKEFFEQNKTADNKNSFLASYSSKSNSYTFSKLNRLISHIFSEVRPEIAKGDASWEQWKKDNPDWNKVLLVPVTTSSDSQGNIIAVTNDLNVNSAKLIGGEELNSQTNDSEKIQMSVIYTRPHQ